MYRQHLAVIGVIDATSCKKRNIRATKWMRASQREWLNPQPRTLYRIIASNKLQIIGQSWTACSDSRWISLLHLCLEITLLIKACLPLKLCLILLFVRSNTPKRVCLPPSVFVQLLSWQNIQPFWSNSFLVRGIPFSYPSPSSYLERPPTIMMSKQKPHSQ